MRIVGAVCAAIVSVLPLTAAGAATAYVKATVNLRSSAATTGEIVARIPSGSKIDASNCAEGWCAATWRGKSGFAIQAAIDLSGRPPPRRRAPVVYRDRIEPFYYGPPVYYRPPVSYYGYSYWRRPYGYGGWRRRW